MARRYKEGILPFKVVATDESLIARYGLLLPYEMAKALKLPEVIDDELPELDIDRGYKPSGFVMSLILMFHGGGKKLENLRKMKAEVNLRELSGKESLPALCTIVAWLRRMGENSEGLLRLDTVNYRPIGEVVLRDERTGYSLDVDVSMIESEKEEGLELHNKGENGYRSQMFFLFGVGLLLESESSEKRSSRDWC